MTQARLSIGKQRENRACRELRRRGYAVLARRYRTRFGEIDIIARDGDTLVFVEVKTRRSAGFGGQLAAVNFTKQYRLVNMARSYLMGLCGPESRRAVSMSWASSWRWASGRSLRWSWMRSADRGTN